MADFFSRLVERSLGLSPVVQPAIAPRFSSAPAIANEVNAGPFLELAANPRHWNEEVELSSTPVDSSSSIKVLPRQPVSTPEEQFSPPEPQSNSAINPLRGQAPQDLSLTPSLLNQTIQPASTLPELNSEQVTPPVANPIAIAQSIAEEPNQAASLAPFRVLQPRQQVPVERHPSLPTAQPEPELSNVIEPISHNSFAQLTTPQPHSDRSIASNPMSLTQPTAPIDLRSDATAPFPQVSVEPAATSPTIRVSIGRVEVRAIMPTPPVPRAAPVRSRPAVSLNDYLKQRGISHE